MSSAAVQQTTPQHYQSTTSPREKSGYSNSPSQSRRHAGRSSSGGYGSTPNTPQQSHYQAGGPVTAPHDTMSASTYQQYHPEPVKASAVPATIPIRTSQPQQSPPTAYDSRQYGSSQAGYGSDSERRRSHQPTSPPAQQTSNRSQRSRNAPQPSRSQNAVGQTPIDTSLPRENSAIINHIVVDDPQSDLARERARIAEARPSAPGSDPAGIPGIGLPSDAVMPESNRHSTGQRSRQEHLKQQSSSNRKEVKFGDYILGQTLGEGEFGKVKMGWKKDGGVQVAIKLIRKESLAGNTTRLPKIYREIAILRELQHPNIVRLHEFVETERHMGIILEYASGGELFDYILNHRYLKDPAARRLFAQLVSGVGYLHKKGIVHRDLKLENLLLDRNRNIIITDFGFANTFNPNDELGDDIELRIGDKEFVKREGLDAIGKDGHRRGDLMQTSCGSPCYAAPELVVSDGLYTGRKVDVWSCGVILYAMLAGYLPFDDDPANPEGDNINLLYKYIVSTPLTFPEYVTPHARDLLRRILVPEPRRRADLFEVARHSWLSEFSHVVGFIGSTTKSERDIAGSAWQGEEEPVLGRSASVREPASRSPPALASPTNRAQAQAIEEEAVAKQRDAKRRTVQVEYVAPNANTTRGDSMGSPSQAAQTTSPVAPSSGRTRARAESSGPVEVPAAPPARQAIPRKEVAPQAMPPPTRPNRESVKAPADNTGYSNYPMGTPSTSRPNTADRLGSRLPSRGNSYSQPAIATPTTENAQGRFSQPKSNSGYIISGPMPSTAGSEARPVSQQNLSQFTSTDGQQPMGRSGHKRSTTLGSLTDRMLGRTNSKRQASESPAAEKREQRRYPPVSMRNAMPPPPAPTNSNNNAEPQPRPSTESGRRPSFSFMRKNSENQSENKRGSRRFSFFSMNSFTGRKDQPYDSVSGSRRGSMLGKSGRPESKGMAFGRGASPSQSTSNSSIPLYQEQDRAQQRQRPNSRGNTLEKPLPQAPGSSSQRYPTASPPSVQRKQYRDDGYGNNILDQSRQDPPERFYTPGTDPGMLEQQQSLDSNPAMQPQGSNTAAGRKQYAPPPSSQNNAYDQQQQPSEFGELDRQGSNSIRPNQRRFGDAYDQGHGGSSSGARRVMDFFRRRGKDRSQQ